MSYYIQEWMLISHDICARTTSIIAPSNCSSPPPFFLSQQLRSLLLASRYHPSPFTPTMSEMDTRLFLPKMIGEEITIHCPDRSNAKYATLYPTRKWLIMEKLSEEPTPITQQDFAIGMGPAYTAGKYFCRLAGAGNETKLAFMRVYKQIPLIDTENEDCTVRKKQACGPRNHPELGALKRFTENGCTATPLLLGYEIGKQDKTDLIPGGYIIYLVWEKVTGDSLDIEKFWMYMHDKRQKIQRTSRRPIGLLLGLDYHIPIAN